MKIIQARAPTRVDFAGGTLDLWPLYVFHKDSVTINLAIDIYTYATIIPRNNKTITLRSLDTGVQKNYRNLSSLVDDPTEDLKLLRVHAEFWKPQLGFELITQSESPVGGGIAGSSSLNISLCGAFQKFTKSKFSNEALIRIAGNLEAQVIKTPTGSQDYYPPLYGGLNIIEYSLRGPEHKNIKLPLGKIAERLTVVYTGRPHHSGLNNWQIYKAQIEGENKTHNKLAEIRNVAVKMKAACLKKDLKSLGGIFQEEYKARVGLSSVFSSPEIERLRSIALSEGAEAIKICGAGGGGCVFLWSAPSKKSILEEKCVRAGFQVLQAKPVDRGLKVSLRAN